MLIGPGGSGKTAIFKNLLYSSRNVSDEHRHYVLTIRENILGGLQELLEINERLVNHPSNPQEREKYRNLRFDDHIQPALTEIRHRLAQRDSNPDQDHPPNSDLQVLDSHTSDFIHKLWTKDPNKTLEQTLFAAQQNQCTLTHDTLAFFFNNIQRIGDRMYKPSLEDCLRSRIRTNGIVQTQVVSQNQNRPITLYDAGGQRHERSKWIHVLQWVDLVLFTVSLTGYSQTLFEDPEKNRLDEALSLFQSMCSSHLIRHASLALVFTKKDLLQKRLQAHPFTHYHPGFKGDATNPELVTNYIKGLFTQDKKQSNIPVFIVNSLDRQEIRRMIEQLTT